MKVFFLSVDFRNLVDLIGHDGKVTSITWSKDDQFLGKCLFISGGSGSEFFDFGFDFAD